MFAYFGAGCFWGVEAEFRKLDGVLDTSVGYMGGHTKDPTYEQVCTDLTGHVEVVEVEFDNTVISYSDLVILFMNMHDPTQLNRQGPDVGSQYRSVIFYIDDDQKNIALTYIKELNQNMKNKIVTAVEPKENYYKGEEYHQKYLEKRGLSSCHANLM